MPNPERVRLDPIGSDPPSPPTRNITLGEILRRARVAKGLSVDDVAHVLHIRQRQLQAMEEDDLGQLPSAVHARGLLRVYARHLDLDPERIVDLLDVDRYWVQPDGVSPTAPPIRSAPSSIQRVLIATVTISLVVAAGYSLVRQYAVFLASATGTLISTSMPVLAADPTPLTAERETQIGMQPVEEPSVTPVPSTPTPAPSPTPATTTVVGAPAPSGRQSTSAAVTTVVVSPSPTPLPAVRIEAQITGRVWLQVEVDGAVAFSGILDSGEKRAWTGEREVRVWAGRPDFIQVTRNGRSEGPLGAPSEAGRTWRWTAS